MSEIEVDNLIIGAGLVGSLTARTLAQHGEKGLLLERSEDAGGVNGSFQDSKGNWFDYGRHVIHSDRSEFTRDYVMQLLDGKLNHFDLERSIVIKGQVIGYAEDFENWPAGLKEKIKLDPAVPIILGSDRNDYARAYGEWFADLVFDEMLQAYPSLRWQRDKGVPEAHLMRWIFPWFFPRTGNEVEPSPGTEINVYSEESRDYHYRTRHSNPPIEKSMYPADEGYGAFIQALLDDSREHFDLQLGMSDIEVDIDPDTLVVKSVSAAEKSFRAKRVFWCAPLPVLCRYLHWPLPRGEAQWELLGSFTFKEPVSLLQHEVLFADPDFQIRRINNPGRIAGQDKSCTLQVEYTSLGEELNETADSWQQRWLANLRQLGFVTPDNDLLEFDFRRVSRGVVSNEDLNGFLQECKSQLRAGEGNLVTPHLAIAADNNCRLIPEVCQYVNSVIRAT